MMNIDEGNILLNESDPHKSGSTNQLQLLDSLIDGINPNMTYLLTLCLALGNAADAVEIMCVGFIITELDGITSTDKEFLSAAVFMGMLFGGVLCGIMSDRFGRKPCLLLSLGVNLLGGIASCFVLNINMLILCRVIGGIGIGGSVPVVFGLGSEIFPSPIRGKNLSLIASFWMVGAIYTALTAWLLLGDDINGNKIIPYTNWRIFAGTSAIPAAIAFIMTYYILPESPRYLVNNKKFKEAANVLHYLTNFPVNPDELRASSENHNKNSSNNENSEKSAFFLLFSNDIYKSTLVLLVIWFTLSFGSYGISTWISTLFVDVGVSNPFADAFIFALANLPGNVLSVLLIEKYGRRRLLAYGMCLASISAIGFAVGTKSAFIVVACAALFNAFSVMGWNSLDCLSVECFPCNVRTSAMGILAASGRLGAISAQFVNGSLEKNIPLLLFITGGCTMLGGLISWALPEDNIESLDEIHLFESNYNKLHRHDYTTEEQ
eukprot:gene9256-12471_t